MIKREEVIEIVEDVGYNNSSLGWRVWRAGAYTHSCRVHLFIAYHGQGLDGVVHGETYDDICEFADVLLDEDYSNEDRVDLILDRIAGLRR